MKLLVIRFSALGDVAMTVPVIDSLARQYPELDITVLSRPFMQPLFAEAPSNVHFRGVDVNRYKGLGGLFRLFRELKKRGIMMPWPTFMTCCAPKYYGCFSFFREQK